MRSKLLIISVLIALFPLSQATTLIVSPRGGNYSGIQDAIDNATSGDTILVEGGTYSEILNVSKPVTLTGMTCPEIRGASDKDAVTINADGVILEGFVVKYSRGNEDTGDPLIPSAGIRVNSNNSTIRFNYVYSNSCGIFVRDSSNNFINHNMVENNEKYAIYLLNSSDSDIYSNHAISNECGIYLKNSSDNVIDDNIVKRNRKYGIQLINSMNNAISRNDVESNRWSGIYLQYSSGNNISKNNLTVDKDFREQTSGIALYGSLSNIISDNRIVKNKERGISLVSDSSNNIISDNLVDNHHESGICLQKGCTNNTIVGNTAEDTENYGIYVWGSCNNNTIESNEVRFCTKAGILIMIDSQWNRIYGNNFIGYSKTTNVAFDANGTNSWDNGSSGNYYEVRGFDYTDSDGDGICDTGYNISSDSGNPFAVDRYPLASKAETAGVQETSSETS